METTNLDGESALKPREAIPALNIAMFQENKIKDVKGILEVDQPNTNIYSVNGSIELEGENIKTFFNIDNVLLRGTSLKNVDFVYGLVIYTGVDTKIMKNIQTFSHKSSSIEKTLNKVIIVVIIIVFSICVGLTMFGMIFLSANVPNYEMGQLKSEYIYYAQNSSYNFTLEFFSLFGAFFIIFNNVIPISLTITFEIAKIIQVGIISKDSKLYDISKNENFKILSLKLQEDLGNVKYIFTDKTGTLTRNEMLFRACSIYSKLYFDDEDNNKIEKPEENLNATNEELSNTQRKMKKSVYSPQFNLESITQSINSDLPILIDDIEDSYYKSTRDIVIEFFLNIALNHNILTETDSEGNIFYQGTNPDEVTLVTAAKEVGVEYECREGPKIKVKIDGNEYYYEVLHKFEFSSERARSSIIVRDLQNNEIKLFMKGSDEKIFKMLNSFSFRNLEAITKEHLDKFAKTGLRTLCFAVKIIEPMIYEEWNIYYREIKYKCLSDKSYLPKLDEHIANLEEELILIGVSGLEDRLQEDVRNTITQLLEADIQMWMITGDKLDTAESIGYSSKFFDEDTEVFKIKNSTNKDEVLENIKQILENINNTEKQVNKMKLERKKKKKGSKKTSPRKSKRKQNIEMSKLKNSFKSEKINMKNIENKLNDNEKEKEIKISGEFNLPTNEHRFDNNEDVSKVASNFSDEINIRVKKKDGIDISKHEKIEPLNKFRTQKVLGHILNDFVISDQSIYSDEIQDISEHPSIVDDVSIMKFMLDRNFFDNSITSKKDFANTFKNKIIHLAVNRSSSNTKIQFNNHPNIEKNSDIVLSPKLVLSKPSIDNNQMQIMDANNDNNIKDKIGNKNNVNEIPLSIRLNNRNNLEIGIFNTEKHLESENEVEEIDIPNLYNYYRNELKKIQERKNSMRKILQFTNLDFRNFKKKKTEDEDHDMKNKNLLNFGILIEGNSVSHCLDEDIKDYFWKVIKKSKSIVCCRCTPIQKSDIVNFVKNKSGEVCLAIGDGGNDVNMIKAANVGIGIFGKEGYQAAYNSDYAISQFKYLKRLLFYHGRFSLLRNSYFIYFFFYKSLIFNMPNLWFAFFNGFSGTLLWDSLYFICYTSILSTMPPVVIMVFEEDIDMNFDDYENKDILNK